MTHQTLPTVRTLLGVWAHPDDEAYLSSSLMAAVRRTGARVVVVTATRGEHGTDDPARWPPKRLAEQRERELRASLDVVGVTEHHWLDHRDGELSGVPTLQGARELVPFLEPAGAGHHRHLRPGRDDRARRPPGDLGLGHRGLAADRAAGRALVRHPHPGVPRRVGCPQRRGGALVRGLAAAGDAVRRARRAPARARRRPGRASTARCVPTPRRPGRWRTSSGPTSTAGGGPARASSRPAEAVTGALQSRHESSRRAADSAPRSLASER